MTFPQQSCGAPVQARLFGRYDGDGIANWEDPDDADGDGVNDFLDQDDDNDGIPDDEEEDEKNQEEEQANSEEDKNNGSSEDAAPDDAQPKRERDKHYSPADQD